MLMLRFIQGNQRKSMACALLLATLMVAGCTPNTKNKIQTTVEPTPKAKVIKAPEPDPVSASDQYKRALKLLKSDTHSTKAVNWLERAAMQGHGDAAYRLATLQNQASQQIDWYSMAASVGQVDAQFALGDAYLNGQGTAKEPAWGLLWIERAARAGNAKAQFAMGVAIATGLTGAPIRDEGLVWVLIAKQNGYVHADSMISILKARLTQTVIDQVKERAKAWTNEPSGDAQTRANVRFAQYALGRMGFDAGLADGISGDRTQNAIKAFRQSKSLGKGGLDAHIIDLMRERLSVFNH